MWFGLCCQTSVELLMEHNCTACLPRRDAREQAGELLWAGTACLYGLAPTQRNAKGLVLSYSCDDLDSPGESCFS
jgi:hypothetical protein